MVKLLRTDLLPDPGLSSQRDHPLDSLFSR
jgi:hypothetical protein